MSTDIAKIEDQVDESNIYSNIEQVDEQQTSFRRFSQCQWNKIEIKYTDSITPTVLNIMEELGSTKKIKNVSAKVNICGDDIYLEVIRPRLEKIGYVQKMIIKKTPFF